MGRNLLERLSANQNAILSFAFHEGSPFTNNQAEKDIRTVKTKQKVSACFRTVAGENHYARIQGFISTIRNQNPFQSLKSVLENNFNGQMPNNYENLIIDNCSLITEDGGKPKVKCHSFKQHII